VATTQDPALFVIFGGTGDLATRKLFPALAGSITETLLDERTRLIGVGRAAKSDDAFRDDIRAALAAAKFTPEQSQKLLARLHYQSIGESTLDNFRALAQRLQSVCEQHRIPMNYAFYLSLPPEVMPATVTGIGEAGLNRRADGWTRIVLEKPFGRDLASSSELSRMVHRYFSEDQIYRIDHYLGKETVQNLLVFRLANGLIESAWNRERIDSVQITVGETLGVGSRAAYYDNSGALRDMVQNHLAQLLTLAAMEVPATFDAAAIRYEKLKVLRSIAPINPERVVRGQYVAGTCAGEQCKGYLDEPGIARNSQTETFVALELFIDTWRWKGVPFYLRTGKRMPRKITQLAIRFREAPVSYFRKLSCNFASADVLTITLQPNEGFSFHFDIKVPGEPFRLEQIPLRFRYEDHYPAFAESYQTLLLDVLEGDQTLFVDTEEVEESWKLFMPLIERPTPLRRYAAGTWGPPEADSLAIPEAALWQAER
jgi:glucose-6-phosphate 1-dehydrogenase